MLIIIVDPTKLGFPCAALTQTYGALGICPQNLNTQIGALRVLKTQTTPTDPEGFRVRKFYLNTVPLASSDP